MLFPLAPPSGNITLLASYSVFLLGCIYVTGQPQDSLTQEVWLKSQNETVITYGAAAAECSVFVRWPCEDTKVLRLKHLFVAGTLFFCSLCWSCWWRETWTPTVRLNLIKLKVLWVISVLTDDHIKTRLRVNLIICVWLMVFNGTVFCLQMLEYKPCQQVNHLSLTIHLFTEHVCLSSNLSISLSVSPVHPLCQIKTPHLMKPPQVSHERNCPLYC